MNETPPVDPQPWMAEPVSNAAQNVASTANQAAQTVTTAANQATQAVGSAVADTVSRANQAIAQATQAVQTTQPDPQAQIDSAMKAAQHMQDSIMQANQGAMAMSQSNGVAAVIISLVFTAVYLLVILAMIAGQWKVFGKAGKPGWASIVPIYNIIVMFEISGLAMPWWYALIPFLNIYAMLMVSLAIAKKFGKTDAYGIGLFLAPFVFYPMLGFGSAVYNKDA